MEIIWWDSFLRSVGSEFFLRLKQTPTLGSVSVTRRLSVNESSTGENSAFAENWVRASENDWESLTGTVQKVGQNVAVVLDLWGAALRGSNFYSFQQELVQVAERAGCLIVLFPKVDFGGLEAFLSQLALSPRQREEHLRFLRSLRSNYEFLLNFQRRLVMVETAVPLKDLVESFALDFAQSPRLFGFVQLLPRELAGLPLSFVSPADLAEAILKILGQFQAGERTSVHVSVKSSDTHSFQARPVGSVARGMERSGWLVRRRDGAFVLATSWRRYHRLAQRRVSEAFEGVFPGDQMGPFLAFLLKFEAISGGAAPVGDFPSHERKMGFEPSPLLKEPTAS